MPSSLGWEAGACAASAVAIPRVALSHFTSPFSTSLYKHSSLLTSHGCSNQDSYLPFAGTTSASPAMASTTPAITAVFSTTELVTAVLEELDIFHDIVCAMRVCKKFRDVIQHSKSAPQHLFLEPLSILSLDEYGLPDDCTEWLCPIYTVRPDYPSVDHWGWSAAITIDVPLLLKWKEMDSPWLQMFVTQPPTYMVFPGYISRSSRSRVYTGRAARIIERASGVRCIDVLECFLGIMQALGVSDDWVWSFNDPDSEASRLRSFEIQAFDPAFHTSHAAEVYGTVYNCN